MKHFSRAAVIALVLAGSTAQAEEFETSSFAFAEVRFGGERSSGDIALGLRLEARNPFAHGPALQIARAAFHLGGQPVGSLMGIPLSSDPTDEDASDTWWTVGTIAAGVLAVALAQSGDSPPNTSITEDPDTKICAANDGDGPMPDACVTDEDLEGG